MDLTNYTLINPFKQVYENKEVASNTNSMISHPHNAHTKQVGPNIGCQFNPYTDNKGTTIGKSIITSLKNTIAKFINQILK